jgi:hypothetical protein
MSIKCDFLSNKGNGHNCKISSRDQKTLLLQTCRFYNGNGKNGSIKGTKIFKSEMLCKMLDKCYAKKSKYNYWKTVIVPQVQAQINSIEEFLRKK